MNFKKTSAALMAAAVLAVAAPMTGVLPDPLGVVASAAEAKLVTGELDAAIAEKLIGNDFVNLGKGYYILKDTVPDPDGLWSYSVVNKIVRIGDKEIEQWRSTGKLEPTTIQCDVDVSGMRYNSGNFKSGSYVTFAQGIHYYVLKLDEAANKLTKAYDFTYGETMYGGVLGLSGGQSICFDDGPSSSRNGIYDVYSPTGEKLETKIPKPGYVDSWRIIDSTSKYMGYFTDNGFYGICKDGNVEKIAEVSGYIANGGGTWTAVTDGQHYYIYNALDGQLHDLGNVNDDIYAVNGSVVTVKSSGYFKLIDLNGKDLSKTYANMETYDDGKTYLVQSADGKWGYIDSTGKELAMFDDAGSFSGEGLYAPVVKDGKGWLVDKNMNQVSEKIDAVGCTTFGFGQLIRFVTAKDSNGNATADVWVTAAANGSGSTETPTNPTVTTKQQSFHDDKTNITVDGKFPENTTLKTEAKQNTDTKVSWDISPVDANGNKVQPDGNATVKLPIPETFKGKTVYVYRIENGKYTALESAVEGNYIVFKTNHFSEYVLTTEKVEEKPSDNPNTGVSAAAFGVVALAGAFVIVSRKKR